MCNPDDADECISCDETGLCCAVEADGSVSATECADCSGADPDNFNPADCVPLEEYR